MDLLEVNKAKCFEFYNTDEERFKKDIAIIQEWMKSQQHLPPMDEQRIGGILLRSKLSLEKTKKRIDWYFTVKSSFPDINLKMDPALPFFEKVVTYAPMKKTTDKNERVHILRYHPSEDLDMFQTFITTSIIQEMLMKYDFNCGNVSIVDMAGCNWDFYKKFTPLYLKTANFYTKRVYGMKTNKIILLNASSLIENVLAIAKPFMDKKIFDRVQVCPDLETLHSAIDKNLLPKEYGGENNETLEELGKMWKQAMLDRRPYFMEIMNEKVDESKRIEKSDISMEELHGSFRQLEFD